MADILPNSVNRYPINHVPLPFPAIPCTYPSLPFIHYNHMFIPCAVFGRSVKGNSYQTHVFDEKLFFELSNIVVY